ncbi:HAMP domain-containing sensor histidine kinase [Synechocystis sp. LKSZ1]|uniref:sensor histidine kinase n=1 Tax=Synechocystis sp. LKSZ1 TaxID=3144951 RepID=UPI00336BE8FE
MPNYTETFYKIRFRLLLSYLLVFAALLVAFAIAVRLFVVHSFNEILINKLLYLGEDAEENTKINDGQIIVNNQAIKDILMREGVVEWFDNQGNLIAKHGAYKTTVPATGKINSQMKARLQKKIKHSDYQMITNLQKSDSVLTNDAKIKSIVLPLYGIDKQQAVGYLKISQPLKELDENTHNLDWGLSLGIVLSLGFSGLSGIWLTRQAMRPIDDSFQQLRQFTADASHELRSPLMAIKANAKVALKYPEGMRPDDQKKFMLIANSAEQMSRLTDDLLFLVRHENYPSIHWESLNLTAILEDIIQLYSPLFEAKKVACKASIEMGLFINGDPSQIHRLFSNLVNNALNYTLAEGEISIEASSSQSHIIGIVKDNGIGIAPEHLPHIFNRFWRADQARSYHQGGSGLGLAIAATIVHNHHGSIHVTSELNQGTCFTVSFPKGSKL